MRCGHTSRERVGPSEDGVGSKGASTTPRTIPSTRTHVNASRIAQGPIAVLSVPTVAASALKSPVRSLTGSNGTQGQRECGKDSEVWIAYQCEGNGCTRTHRMPEREPIVSTHVETHSRGRRDCLPACGRADVSVEPTKPAIITVFAKRRSLEIRLPLRVSARLCRPVVRYTRLDHEVAVHKAPIGTETCSTSLPIVDPRKATILKTSTLSENYR